VTRHFQRPKEAPFQAAERGHVTVLFGGLTWKHEVMIQAVLRRSGLLCQRLPEPDRDAHEIGKEYCCNGLCNPAYFTVGNLIRYLRELERTHSREEIVRNYLFFSAGSDGPCRFGMYEAECRAALKAAGYDGFRVLSFLQDDGIKARSGQSGFQFDVDFGLDALHAFIIGDVLNNLHRRLSPYEVHPGAALRTVEAVAANVARALETNPRFELCEAVPAPLRFLLPRDQKSKKYRTFNTLGKVWSHLYGRKFFDSMAACREPLREMGMETDWLRVKPVVKVIGEFWAQETEGDGNFQMFRFLEKEGAEVRVEPISCWLLYLLHQFKHRGVYRSRMLTHIAPIMAKPLERLKGRLSAWKKRAGFALGEGMYKGHYKRMEEALMGEHHPLPPQIELARLAMPYFNTGLRGGEGHLEVGKNLYYTKRRLSHMVLALKPFGCMPSLQSDAVQAGLAERYPEMVFLSIETAGEGEIHAYSRVQMALAEARVKAQSEFESVVSRARRPLAEIRRFVAQHPELRSPTLQISRRPGVISTAANFVMDVDELMNRTGDRGRIACSDAFSETLEGEHNALSQEA
jgi:predicted nucleotide-binding protein (sugar kinase/HSP70/actin superfamily)